MNKVIVDGPLRQKLQGLTHEMEFLDETGQTLGKFLPTNPIQGLPGEPTWNEDELNHIEQSSEWFTTEQVLAQFR